MSSSENTVQYHFHIPAQTENYPITINFNTGKNVFKIETNGQQKKEEIVIEPLDIPEKSGNKNDFPAATRNFNFGNYLSPNVAFTGKANDVTPRPTTNSKFKLEPLKSPEEFGSSKFTSTDEVIGTDCMGFNVTNKKHSNNNEKKKRPIADDLSLTPPELMSSRVNKQKRTQKYEPFTFCCGM